MYVIYIYMYIYTWPLRPSCSARPRRVRPDPLAREGRACHARMRSNSIGCSRGGAACLTLLVQMWQIMYSHRITSHPKLRCLPAFYGPVGPGERFIRSARSRPASLPETSELAHCGLLFQLSVENGSPQCVASLRSRPASLLEMSPNT